MRVFVRDVCSFEEIRFPKPRHDPREATPPRLENQYFKRNLYINKCKCILLILILLLHYYRRVTLSVWEVYFPWFPVEKTGGNWKLCVRSENGGWSELREVWRYSWLTDWRDTRSESNKIKKKKRNEWKVGIRGWGGTVRNEQHYRNDTWNSSKLFSSDRSYLQRCM